ncbi:hypothetical protein TRFO_34276 [Tritrichomonas foetus]|uniref:Uncharacterized protein n=1 Tax=Tritrichomonas foetus TaxID=1144522 RepID=A0A1J4JJH6_9EUKA|nr:hypothetical protein TRFO_34276 [Tritrichomonas foetus]|eukprot:OHS99304.1 hypothetical protein TRFO_34276 [Tritrichomonas foetus]
MNQIYANLWNKHWPPMNSFLREKIKQNSRIVVQYNLLAMIKSIISSKKPSIVRRESLFSYCTYILEQGRCGCGGEIQSIINEFEISNIHFLLDFIEDDCSSASIIYLLDIIIRLFDLVTFDHLVIERLSILLNSIVEHDLELSDENQSKLQHILNFCQSYQNDQD